MDCETSVATAGGAVLSASPSSRSSPASSALALKAEGSGGTLGVSVMSLATSSRCSKVPGRSGTSRAAP
eukprot:4006986-Lingulodinium_polyedra.AAC.1